MNNYQLHDCCYFYWSDNFHAIGFIEWFCFCSVVTLAQTPISWPNRKHIALKNHSRKSQNSNNYWKSSFIIPKKYENFQLYYVVLYLSSWMWFFLIATDEYSQYERKETKKLGSFGQMQYEFKSSKNIQFQRKVKVENVSKQYCSNLRCDIMKIVFVSPSLCKLLWNVEFFASKMKTKTMWIIWLCVIRKIQCHAN